MSRYSCSYSGVCEVDETGEYASKEDCQVACVGRENKDLLYLVHEYDLMSAKLLAPSDRVAVLRRLTGVTLNPADSMEIIDAILINDYETLARVDELLPWIRKRHPFSLLFKLPIGSMSLIEKQTFIVLSNAAITALAVKYGVKLDNLRFGDIVRFGDIINVDGGFVGFVNGGLIKISYPGFVNHPKFHITSVPRVDYFRYALPDPMVVLAKRKLPPVEEIVTIQISRRGWRLEWGKYRIHVRDLDAFRAVQLNPARPNVNLHYIIQWDKEDSEYPNDLYYERD